MLLPHIDCDHWDCYILQLAVLFANNWMSKNLFFLRFVRNLVSAKYCQNDQSLMFVFFGTACRQCFYTVGRASGRASACKNLTALQ